MRVAIGITYLPPREKFHNDSTMDSANQPSDSADKSNPLKIDDIAISLKNEPLSAKANGKNSFRNILSSWVAM